MDARVERRDITYDDLMALPYLDAVCKETLRLCVGHTRLSDSRITYLTRNIAQVCPHHSVASSVSTALPSIWQRYQSRSKRSRENTAIPLSRPVLGRDGQTIDCIHVQAGTMVVVGTAAMNRDPALWGPDAGQWIPERWLRPLPDAVADAYSPGASSHMFVFLEISPADNGAD